MRDAHLRPGLQQVRLVSSKGPVGQVEQGTNLRSMVVRMVMRMTKMVVRMVNDN